MKFQLSFNIPDLPLRLSLDQSIVLLGSCFSENIGEKLINHKFNTTINPHGTLYQPLAINQLIKRCFVDQPHYRIESHDNLFYDLDSHSQLSATSESELVHNIQLADNSLKEALLTASWMVITPGTAWVYDLQKDGKPVANCHKIPQSEFRKRLLQPGEIVASWEGIIQQMRTINPKMQWLFTVSPVRHIRDGLIENNHSKAILIQAVHQIVGSQKNCHYFPSYEILIDELRDYRFYADDMIHPSALAVEYIWQKLITHWMDKEAQAFVPKWKKILEAMNHRPFHPGSTAHHLFLDKTILALQDLRIVVNVEEEIELIRKGFVP